MHIKIRIVSYSMICPVSKEYMKNDKVLMNINI